MKKKKRSRKKKERNDIPMLIVVIIELLVLLLLVSYLPSIVSLNTNDPLFHKDTAAPDEISCTDGNLNVNSVSVPVPTTGNVDYSISYSWAEDDTDYPSVPHAVVAKYSDDDGNVKYEISLYKDSYYTKKEVPKGKTAANWFDDWEEMNKDGIQQFKRNAGDLQGFYISTLDTAESADEEDSVYVTYTYYFAFRTPEKGIGVYVLEGVCYDPEYADTLSTVMTGSINKISFKNKA